MDVGQRIQTAQASYEVIAHLGSGGQGVTWKVRREGDGEEAVYKALHVEALEDWKGAELFQREIEVLRGLDIRGVPKLLDVVLDEASERVGYIQELVPGAPLSGLIAQKTPLSAERFEAYLKRALELAEALHSHAPPIVHRDITPSNLLVDGDRLWLIDFGAVKASLREATVLTSVGTFGYMAPEQTLGRAVPQSDLYSIGVSFTALAARAEPEHIPIDPDTGRIDVASVTTHLPNHVRDLLIALTQPGLSQRPSSASQALALLNKPPQRSPRRAVMIGLGVVALALFVAPAVLIFPGNIEDAPDPHAVQRSVAASDPPAPPIQRRAPPAQPAAPAPPTARRTDDTLTTTGEPRALVFSPNGAALAVFTARELVVWEVKTRTVRCTLTLEGDYESAAGQPYWSGDRIWAALYDTRLHAYHADTCKPAQRIAKLGDLIDGVEAHTLDTSTVTRDAQGEPVHVGALAASRALVAARVHDGPPKVLARWSIKRTPALIVASRDGSTLGVLTRHRGERTVETMRIDAPDAPPTTYALPLDSHVNNLAITPDGARLAVLYANRISVFERGASKPARALELGRFDYSATHNPPLVFSNDGALLAAASENKFTVLDPNDNTIVDDFRTLRSAVLALAFSPDGAWIASASKDKTVALWPISKPKPKP